MSVRASFRPSVRTDSAGEGEESHGNPTGGGDAFGQPAFFLAGIRMTIVTFEKEVSLKV